MPRIADHDAERVAKRRRDQQNGEHFQQVRQRRRILIRMRAVGVEEAAAVGAELLDRDLRCGRPQRQGLRRHEILVRVLRWLKPRNLFVRSKILHNALRHEQQGQDQRQWHEHIKRRTHEIDPVIADRLGRSPSQPANHREENGDAGRRGHEILHAEPGHLRQIAERGFTAVVLPVRVARKARGRVEREISRHVCEILRIERQRRLQPLQRIDREKPNAIEQQECDGVRLPAHLRLRIDAREPIDAALQPTENRIESARLSLENAGHVPAERLDECHQHDQVNRQLYPRTRAHENHSGFKNATTRYAMRLAAKTSPTSSIPFIGDLP